MPIFAGENPEGWIFRAKRYFVINRLTGAEKLEAAVISLDGDALAWFQWEDRRQLMRLWSGLKVNLLHRFGRPKG